ncbi:MAG: response regulator [Aequorivita sp.]|nr:response regulator [Aequorivita sp.]|tara:strand:+ start:1660 stop:2340 length:681 start_codon:yes stop_codon:yes gene_type:complete
MEAKEYNTLIIDDHPLIIEAFRNALLHIAKTTEELEFSITEATSCDTAQHIMERYNPHKTLDLVFLDIKLPPSPTLGMLSGEDLGLEIREKHPQAKIVVATTFNDNYRIQNIFRNINPEGFVIKSDIDTETLVAALMEVLLDPPYYSKTVLQAIRKYISHDYLLDKWDRHLLYELSQGTKMKELPDLMPFSLGALEKRKRQLKIVFDVEDGEDKQLLQKARMYGFI